MIDKFIASENIDSELHAKMFCSVEFNTLNSKIKLINFNEIRNKIYWISTIIYRITMINMFSNIIPDKPLALRKQDLIVFNPFMLISSEVCNLLKTDYLYTPLTSSLARSIIEQVLFSQES